MKRLIYIIVFYLPAICLGQVINLEASINVENGAHFVMEGDFVNHPLGQIKVDGDLHIYQDFNNHLGGNLSGNGRYHFLGNADSKITFSQDSLSQLVIEKTMANVIINDQGTIKDSVIFDGTNNRVILDENSLIIARENAIVGADAQHYFEADSSGRLVMHYDGLGSQFFPIGDNQHYSPVEVDLVSGIITSLSAIGVANTPRQHPHLKKGTTDYIKRYWHVDVHNIGLFEGHVEMTYDDQDVVGVETNIQGQTYALGREWSHQGKGGHPVLNTVEIDLSNDSEQPTGGNYISQIAMNAWLQGPFSTSGDTMKTQLNKDTVNQTLNILEILATTCPYNPAISVASGFFLAHPDIVDWIMIETREPLDSTTTIDQLYGFITKYGTLLDIEADTGFSFVDHPESFWMVLHHRNHFSATTASPILINELGQSQFDWTIGLGNVWDDPAVISNHAMIELEPGKWGLIRADVDKSGIINVVDLVKTNAATSPNQSDVYVGEDINMDGVTNVVDLILAKAASSPNQSQHVPK